MVTTDEYLNHAYDNKAIDGVVHSVRRPEDQHTFGSTSCFMSFTVEIKKSLMAHNAKNAPDEPVTCMECLAASGFFGGAAWP